MPRHRERGGRQEAERRKPSQAVDHPVGCVYLRRPYGIAQGGVGGEDARDQEIQREQRQQRRGSDRTSGSTQRLAESGGEGEHQSAADEKVDHLHLAAVASRELAHEVMPGAIAGARRALHQEDDDEQKRTNDPCVEQPSHAAKYFNCSVVATILSAS